MPPTYAAFTDAEHHERLARAREKLGQAGFEVCVSVAPETPLLSRGLRRLGRGQQPAGALVFSVAGNEEPTLLVRNVDTRLATETTWLSDLRSYQLFADDFAALVGDVAREKGLSDARVAMELQSYTLNAALYGELVRALAPMPQLGS